MRKAILVLGPESSGTRLATRILIIAGYAGTAAHVQRLDWWTPDDARSTERIVWRRSMPHDRLWPDIGQMVRELRRAAFEVRAVLTDRLDAPMVAAQVRDHVKNEAVATQHIARARVYLERLDDPQGPAMPILRMQYEELVADPKGEINALLQFVDADLSRSKEIADAINIYDGNKSYASEARS